MAHTASAIYLCCFVTSKSCTAQSANVTYVWLGRQRTDFFDVLVFRSIGTEVSNQFPSGMLEDHAALQGVGKGENLRVFLLLWLLF
jgi:hypothetical protein